ncbi:GGDEF domain-containing protein [Streptomyces sp. NPDC006739]|uniref:GGDEF domain-containing protein n=1 Tax=Streptomyces sp. NPDC006739 TaxID=3364763 RepID=UPI00368F4F69
MAVHAVTLHRQLAASHRDPLTGLLRREAYTARASPDPDHFKQINDTMGHAAGDAVLAAFGARLTAWAVPRSSVGRLRGDEFAVVLGLTADRRAPRFQQLGRVLRTPVRPGRRPHRRSRRGAPGRDQLL